MGVLDTKFGFRARASERTSAAKDLLEDNCPICQEAVGSATPEGIVESWSELPCGHRFGNHCLKSWLGLAERPACPVCRRDMLHACGHPFLPPPFVAGAHKTKKNGGGDSRSAKCQQPGQGQDQEQGRLHQGQKRKKGQKKWSGPPELSICRYCSAKRRGRQGMLGRVAVNVLRLLLSRRTRLRLDLAYWEHWRKANSTEFGAWWAAQEPPTEQPRPRTRQDLVWAM